MQTQEALLSFVKQISKEKGLEPEVIKEAIEYAVVSCSKKNLSQYEDARAEMDLETGELQVFIKKSVVERAGFRSHTDIGLKDAQKIDPEVEVGGFVEISIPASDFGRIAAQSARQIIMQRLRDAEREKTFEEYQDRAGLIVTGVIQRFERRDAIVNIGDTEGILPYEEQPYGVRYRFGDRVKCLIQLVEMTPRGPYIRLSRNSPDLILKLFALEVPEIADGIVQVVAIAREPGVRTKVAVTSRSPDVDPVGACVGMKGSRVQMIVREFENEKIDIVPYSPNPMTLISSSLNPAQISRVDLDEENMRATVIVPQDNLSLAIGKRGQNARLASKLTGWQLDIKGAEEEAEEIAAEEARVHYLGDFLEQIEVGEETRAILEAAVGLSVEALSTADPRALAELIEGTEEAAESIRDNAIGYVEALQEMTAEREAAERAEAEETESDETAEDETLESDETEAEESVEAVESEETVEPVKTKEPTENEEPVEAPQAEVSQTEEPSEKPVE